MHGFVADSDVVAKESVLHYEHRMFIEGMAGRGRVAPPAAARAAAYGPQGMVFGGDPDEVADRILHLHSVHGHPRRIIQMDVGGMPQLEFLHGIGLLGAKVLPKIRTALD